MWPPLHLTRDLATCRSSSSVPEKKKKNKRNIFNKIKLLSLPSPPLSFIFFHSHHRFCHFYYFFSLMPPSISCCLHISVMPQPITIDFRGNLKRFLPILGEELQFIPAFHLDWEGLGVRLSACLSGCPSVSPSVRLPTLPACPSIARQGNTASATLGEKTELQIVHRTSSNFFWKG